MARDMSHKFLSESTQEYLLEEEELIQNPGHRVPIVVCVDCSYSMLQGDRLKQVTEGLQQFCHDMARDPIAGDVVELCIISYGQDSAKIEKNFAPPRQMEREMPRLTAAGGTPLADGIFTARAALERHLQRYADNGITPYRPWLIIIGDGDATGLSGDLQEAAQWLKEESQAKHLNVLCILVGDEERIEYASLMQISPDSRVQYLRDLKFKEFFGWLSRSIQKTSQSLSGEEVHYEPTTTWGQVIEGGR